ncbi:hypothetical protein EXIGLDRAFT_755596 [Exidia glandulosa HHB12029]|uniref:Blue (type 1) copper domain-containing protein n=1 Tax=Exidia glandulosa HHB12029 TaxID=1314781 RepID=A0A165BX48_EXIGL|nr:hypothetical protein EXIGLDRAFT_755596 [Exidia glandulosa HHB12029]
MRSQLFVAASLSVLAVAQTTIKVDVGPGGQFVYEPNNVEAKVGDTVSFNIVDPIHTVTQAASIGTPCVQSGFTNPDGATTFDVKVNNTDPIYIYCLPHCALGMVMIINPKNPGDVDSFATVAKGGTLPSAPSSTSSSTPAPSSVSSTSAGTPVPSSPAASTSAPPSGPASGASASTPVNSSPADTGSGAAPTNTDSSGSSIAPSIIGSIGSLILAALL